MDKKFLDSLAQLLRHQREDFLREFRTAEEALEFISADRESELEERAQEERSARLLARMDDRTLHAVQEIDAALQRLLNGTYGACEACGRGIAIARLRTLPASRFCRRCAGQNEKQPAIAVEEPAGPAAGSVPADLTLLDDHELIEVIHEHLKEDGRIDMAELQIVCRKGIVYLSGILPSEAEHQILLQTLTDVLGFQDVVDHLEMEELLWERETRTLEKPPEEIPPWQEPAGTEDIAESTEEDKEFVPPSKPTPKEE